jgi:ribonuclease BN (tRNA processing enzyme)
VKLQIYGHRGSTPTPGAPYVRYGGHTSCVGITEDGGDEPSVLLDAGTGLRALSEQVPGRGFRGAILISHLHLDHVQGLPFFPKGDDPSSEVDVFLPAQGDESGRDLLARWMSPPTFPITPEGLAGSWRFRAIEPCSLRIGNLQVVAFEVGHKGGRAFGYRIADQSGAVGYLPDHSRDTAPRPEVDANLHGVDVLIHDAQFLESEEPMATAYGHYTIPEAIALAEDLAVGELVLFHHAPTRTDDQLDAIGRSLCAPLPVALAREGLTITVGRI